MSNLKQQDYVFIAGKNWKLSLAELASFLESRQLAFKVTSFSKSFFEIRCEKPVESSLIDSLGGTIKIGRIISCLTSDVLERAFIERDKQAREEVKTGLSAADVFSQFFGTSSGKLVFGVSLYLEDRRFLRVSREMHRFIGSFLKEELAAANVKASFMGFPRARLFPQLSHVEVLKKKLIEESAEILVCIGRRQASVSKTIGVHDPFEFQKRDVERPAQRKILSIPPRLSRIMVNLSSCRPGSVFLDPFCGVGTILQEALLSGARVIGVDVNPWCVEASKTNLKWLEKQYDLQGSKYIVLQGDSRFLTRQVDESTVDCIATEPDLGPPLIHLPTESHARRIIDRLRPLYTTFLEESHRVLKVGGKLVFVTPCIRTRAGAFVSLSLVDEIRNVGYETVCPLKRSMFSDDDPQIAELVETSSFVDMEKRHRTGRQIHVFRK